MFLMGFSNNRKLGKLIFTNRNYMYVYLENSRYIYLLHQFKIFKCTFQTKKIKIIDEFIHDLKRKRIKFKLIGSCMFFLSKIFKIYSSNFKGFF